MRLNIGTHTLKLFAPPVPEPNSIPITDSSSSSHHLRQQQALWKRYGKASVRLHIFHGQPRPGSLTPSELSDEGEEILPEVSRLVPGWRKSLLLDETEKNFTFFLTYVNGNLEHIQFPH